MRQPVKKVHGQAAVNRKNGLERDSLVADKTAPIAAVKPATFIKNNRLYIKLNEAELQPTSNNAPTVKKLRLKS